MKRLAMISVASVAAMVLVQGCSNKQPAEESVEQIPEIETTTETPASTAALEKDAKAASAAKVGGSETYIVAKGDTLSAIAAAKGLRWQDVVAVNPGLNPNKLRVGQAIQLPVMPASAAPIVKSGAKKAKKTVKAADVAAPKVASYDGPAQTYVVKSGDTLGLIAKRNKTTVAKLRAANPSLKGDMIRVGQKLQIPTSKCEKKCEKAAAVQKVEEKKAAEKPVEQVKKEEVSAPVENAVAEKPVELDTATPPPVKDEALAPAVTPETAPVAAAPAVEVAPAATPAAAAKTYTVKDGEDVYAVAIRWSVSPNELKKLNNLESSELHAGQVLKIPSDVRD